MNSWSELWLSWVLFIRDRSCLGGWFCHAGFTFILWHLLTETVLSSTFAHKGLDWVKKTEKTAARRGQQCYTADSPTNNPPADQCRDIFSTNGIRLFHAPWLTFNAQHWSFKEWNEFDKFIHPGSENYLYLVQLHPQTLLPGTKAAHVNLTWSWSSFQRNWNRQFHLVNTCRINTGHSWLKSRPGAKTFVHCYFCVMVVLLRVHGVLNVDFKVVQREPRKQSSSQQRITGSLTMALCR